MPVTDTESRHAAPAGARNAPRPSRRNCRGSAGADLHAAVAGDSRADLRKHAGHRAAGAHKVSDQGGRFVLPCQPWDVPTRVSAWQLGCGRGSAQTCRSGRPAHHGTACASSRFTAFRIFELPTREMLAVNSKTRAGLAQSRKGFRSPPPATVCREMPATLGWERSEPGQLGNSIGRRFAAALLPRLFGKNPRSHHKGIPA